MKNRQRSMNTRPFEAMVIGVSAGGLAALGKILPELSEDFPLAVLIVQHMRRDADGFLWRHLDTLSRLTVKEAEDKEAIQPKTVYIAPPDYHLLVEPDRTLSLSADERVNFSRPSIDVLFETAAEVYQQRLIGVILTGANNDGTRGLQTSRATAAWRSFRARIRPSPGRCPAPPLQRSRLIILCLWTAWASF